MIISLVVAASENNVIGKNNQLLWHLPKDMKFFKNVTWGMPVVMGRKTFESMGSKPLSGRKNIVITRKPGWAAEGVSVVNGVDAAVALAEELNYKEIFIIGGGEIYMISFNQASKIYMTRVHAELEGDTYFPELNDDWKETQRIKGTVDDKNKYEHDFLIFEKKP